MAITPGYDTVKESNEVEQHYIDKGAVTTPQVNPMVEKKYREASAMAESTDKVEWPTSVSGQTSQGF
jgi:hypothetical protein